MTGKATVSSSESASLLGNPVMTGDPRQMCSTRHAEVTHVLTLPRHWLELPLVKFSQEEFSTERRLAM